MISQLEENLKVWRRHEKLFTVLVWTHGIAIFVLSGVVFELAYEMSTVRLLGIMWLVGTILLTCLGCHSVSSHTRASLTWFAVLLTVGIIGNSSIMALSIITFDVQEVLGDVKFRLKEQYGNAESIKKGHLLHELYEFQAEKGCCGLDGYNDYWPSTTQDKLFPPSCCKGFPRSSFNRTRSLIDKECPRKPTVKNSFIRQPCRPLLTQAIRRAYVTFLIDVVTAIAAEVLILLVVVKLILMVEPLTHQLTSFQENPKRSSSRTFRYSLTSSEPDSKEEDTEDSTSLIYNASRSNPSTRDPNDQNSSEDRQETLKQESWHSLSDSPPYSDPSGRQLSESSFRNSQSRKKSQTDSGGQPRQRSRTSSENQPSKNRQVSAEDQFGERSRDTSEVQNLTTPLYYQPRKYQLSGGPEQLNPSFQSRNPPSNFQSRNPPPNFRPRNPPPNFRSRYPQPNFRPRYPPPNFQPRQPPPWVAQPNPRTSQPSDFQADSDPKTSQLVNENRPSFESQPRTSQSMNTQPKMSQPMNTQQGMSQPMNSQSRPSQPMNYQPRPSHPMNSQSRPSQPMSYQSRPPQPMNSQSRPSQKMNSQSWRPQPMNSQSRPSQPMNYRPRPSQPMNSQSRPSQPMNYRSRSSQPMNSQSRPSQPMNYQSRPSPPTNSQSRPSQPKNYQSRPSQPISYQSRPVDTPPTYTNRGKSKAQRKKSMQPTDRDSARFPPSQSRASRAQSKESDDPVASDNRAPTPTSNLTPRRSSIFTVTPDIDYRMQPRPKSRGGRKVF